MSEDEDRSIDSASSDELGIESSATSFSGRGDLRPPLPAPFERRERGQDSGSETEPTSRAVPTPPDEAHNERIIAEFKKKLRAWFARACKLMKTEEDRQKIIRVLLEAQGELFSVGRKRKE